MHHRAPRYPLTILQKRKRRDYRLARRAQFTRPEPGFSLYEGRTRGKRPRYTYSDDEGGDSDVISAQRSVRQSGISTPAEPAGPMYTASGRQVKSRHGGAYGESMLSGQVEGAEHERVGSMDEVDGDIGQPVLDSRVQPTASRANRRPGKHIDGYNELDEIDDESDAPSSGNEWDSGAEDEPDDQADDDDEEDDVEINDDENMSAQEGESESEDDGRSRSLVVSLRYSKTDSSPPLLDAINGAPNLKQNDATPVPKPYQINSPNAVRPEKSNEASRPGQELSKHLSPAYLSETKLPPTSVKPFNENGYKLPVTIPDARLQQPPLDASLQPTSAPPNDALEDNHPYKPSIDFQQYQFQPPTR